MNHKKRVIFPLLAAGIMILCGISAAISLAYLRASTESLQNVITAGTIQIALSEENWVPEDHTSVVPGTVIEKNPSITNSGKNAAHVFLEIRVPVRNIAVVDAENRRTERKARELFTFTENETDWRLVERHLSEDQMIYVFAYDKILYPQEKTSALFGTVTIINYLEGELSENEKLQIDVQAKAIQTGIDTVGGSPEEIYSILLSQISAESVSVHRKQEEIRV